MSASALSPEVAQQLAAALRGLAYGSIQLIVHDARIVRIERVERIRLPATWDEGQAGLTDSSEAQPYTRGRPTPTPEVRHVQTQED